ncbi:uncharacterized protein LOC132742159 [Ruditapes philippinarum]|uniref:uncharacterized protein LOC132742159 n=1 Tax=Ruditapes philippinarum TaxID=129788 RepID=UPI00295AF228|nr:uncharacterized protein LOC132742159 [Ruditapes philippinarum]
MKGLHVLLFISVFVGCSSAMFQTGSDNVISRLSHCSAHLYRLVECLPDNDVIVYEVRKCENVLRQTLACLSTSTEDDPYGMVEDDSAEVQQENAPISFVKRGLGRCIHKCLNGQGRMNFIQCKSLCHR